MCELAKKRKQEQQQQKLQSQLEAFTPEELYDLASRYRRLYEMASRLCGLAEQRAGRAATPEDAPEARGETEEPSQPQAAQQQQHQQLPEQPPAPQPQSHGSQHQQLPEQPPEPWLPQQMWRQQEQNSQQEPEPQPPVPQPEDPVRFRASLTARPNISVGAWLCTKATGRSRCRIYKFPPSFWATKFPRETIPLITYLGLIKAVEHTERFVSVLIPWPGRQGGAWGWTNVWKCAYPTHYDMGHTFAHTISQSELQTWESAPWTT